MDIDSNLVGQAHKLLALRASRSRPPTEQSERIVDYFPISVVLSHGYRIEPKSHSSSRGPTTASAESSWPRVSFFCADWPIAVDPDISGPYDVILALSVSINRLWLIAL